MRGDGVEFSFEDDVMTDLARERAAKETAQAKARELAEATRAAQAEAREYWEARQDGPPYAQESPTIARFAARVADGKTETLLAALAEWSVRAIEEADASDDRDRYLPRGERVRDMADFWRWFMVEHGDEETLAAVDRTFHGLPPVLDLAKTRADAIDSLEEALEFDEEPDSSFKRDVLKIVAKAREFSEEGHPTAIAFMDFDDEGWRCPIVTFSAEASAEANGFMEREAKANFSRVDETDGGAVLFNMKDGAVKAIGFVPTDFGFATADEDETSELLDALLSSVAGTPWSLFAETASKCCEIASEDLGLDLDGDAEG